MDRAVLWINTFTFQGQTSSLVSWGWEFTGILTQAYKARAPTLEASMGQYLHRSSIPSSVQIINPLCFPLAAPFGFLSWWEN